MLNPGCAPVPVKVMVTGEWSLSVVIVTLPDASPPAVGANTAFRVALAAPFNVKGVVIPFTLKPVPLTAIIDIGTDVVPGLFKMIDFVLLLPMLKLPKLTDVGFTSNRPGAVVEPVPASATVSVGLAGSLLVMLRVPLTPPPPAG
jgi:hypothetical protein